MTLHPRHNLAISTILGSLAFTVPALALDADDFATKVAALVGQGSAKVSFSSVEPDGDTIVLKSVRMEAPGEPAVEFGDITFDGVEDETGGSYHVDQAIFQDIDFTRDGVRITVDDMELSGLTIPADLDADPIDTISFYEGFSTGMIRVEKDRKEIFSMAGTILDIDRADDDASIGMKMDGSDISVDLSQIKDPKARRALSDLGYTTLSGDLKFDGIWELASGTLNIREYSLNLDEVGPGSFRLYARLHQGDPAGENRGRGKPRSASGPAVHGNRDDGHAATTQLQVGLGPVRGRFGDREGARLRRQAARRYR